MNYHCLKEPLRKNLRVAPTWPTVASDQGGIWVDIQRPKTALGHAASYHHLPFLAPPTIVLLRTPLSTSNIQDATYAISGPNLKDFKQIKNLYYHFVWNKNWTTRSNQALRTPHCCGQFSLSLGKETHYIFPKFNPLNKDTERPYSLRKQPTFGDATTGFPRKWRLRNERRNSIQMTRHYQDLGSASDWSYSVGNLIQPNVQHVIGISALVSPMSFNGKPGVTSPNVGCFLRLGAIENVFTKKKNGKITLPYANEKQPNHANWESIKQKCKKNRLARSLVTRLPITSHLFQTSNFISPYLPQPFRFRAVGSFHCFPNQFCKATLRLRGSHVVLTTCNVEVRTSLLNSAYCACFPVEIY